MRRASAAIGYCFGGSTVQALAYSGAPLAGIVEFSTAGGIIPVPAEAAAKTKGEVFSCATARRSLTSRKGRSRWFS